MRKQNNILNVEPLAIMWICCPVTVTLFCKDVEFITNKRSLISYHPLPYEVSERFLVHIDFFPMFSFLLAKATSYRICPNKIPVRDDLYFEKTVKGEHWSYFTIKLNTSQLYMYFNISGTGNASIYMGRYNKCPYKNDKPFARIIGGDLENQQYVRAWKPSTMAFPIGIYAEEESKIKISIDPVSFEFDYILYGKWILIVCVSIFVVVQFARGVIPFSEMFSFKSNRKHKAKSHKPKPKNTVKKTAKNMTPSKDNPVQQRTK